ncbi:MAG: hypothetical protein ACRD3O_09010 [Terriglobia bacterium]
MNAFTLCGCQLLLAVALTGAQHVGPGATIPAPFPAPEPSHPGLPIDQPPVVVHGDRRQPFNPLLMKKQAAQLTKLAQSISPDMDKVDKGEMPKELIKNLKQIEKLSKELRRELTH